MYQQQWGPYAFRAHLPEHHIGQMDIELSNEWMTETNSSVEGGSQTVAKTRKPRDLSFTLRYVQKHTNQSLENLALFWQDKLGQIWPMIGGGDRAPNLTPYPMQLVACPYKITKFKGGTFAVLEVNFKFTEIFDSYDRGDGWYTSATAIGA